MSLGFGLYRGGHYSICDNSEQWETEYPVPIRSNRYLPGTGEFGAVVF
jgi:hypothetical protein